MDAQTIEQQISICQEWLSGQYQREIIAAKQRGLKSIAVDFFTIPNYEFGMYILENSRDALKIFDLALQRLDLELSKGFSVQLLNLPKSCHVPISAIRIEHANQFLCVEGIVRNQSEVRGEVLIARFECPFCATPIAILQEQGHHLKEPSRCANVSCRHKGTWLRLDDERTNAFSIVLEEPMDMAESVHQPAKLKVLCRGDLTAHGGVSGLYGQRVAITGILRELPVYNGKILTTKIDWFLEANHIKKLGESFEKLTWTPEEEKSFQEFAKQPDWLHQLRQAIFSDIHGHDEECEGVILQLFGCVGKRREGKNVRGNIHILLCGDPGTAKSTILGVAQKFSPKAMLVSATGMSAAGIEGGVVKDELLGGQSLEAGALALCNNGILMLDELDKTADETRGHLHTAMEEEQVTISKIVKGTFMTRTALLAACNPKGGGFSEYDNLFSQIDLKDTLINRFDLVYILLSSDMTPADNEAVMRKMFFHRYEDETTMSPFPAVWVKKYIAYAKKLQPRMERAQGERIQKLYGGMRAMRQQEVGKNSMPITPRNGETIYRLAEAVARSHLHPVITDDDLSIAINKVLYSVRKLGVDPNRGDVVEEVVVKPGGMVKVWTSKDIHARLCSLIRDRGRDGIKIEEIYAIFQNEGLNDMTKIDEKLEALKREGQIFENPIGTYRWI